MKKISVKEKGLVGTFFHQEHSNYLILILGGSSGGLNESRAHLLASYGFSTFALAYFAVENLPPKLKQIPLEYFEKAIDWAKEKAGIEKLGLWGTSRGGELALILGSLFGEKIDAIAAHVPSSAAYGALDEHPLLPAWTFRGQEFLPPAPFVLQFPKESGKSAEDPISVTPSFLEGMQDVEKFTRSMIPVEKIRSPLLLISAEDDKMWPSALFVDQILERLKIHKSHIQITHIHYPKVGHSPHKGTFGLHPILGRWFAYGGEPEQNSIASKEWVLQTVKFFKGRS